MKKLAEKINLFVGIPFGKSEEEPMLETERVIRHGEVIDITDNLVMVKFRRRNGSGTYIECFNKGDIMQLAAQSKKKRGTVVLPDTGMVFVK